MQAAAHHLCDGMARRVWAEFRITDVEWRIMALLADQGEVSVADIGQSVFMEQPQVAKAIHRLIAVGYVSKCKDRKDRRVQYLALTKRGTLATQRLLAVAREYQRRLDDIIGADRESLDRAFDSLLRESL